MYCTNNQPKNNVSRSFSGFLSGHKQDYVSHFNYVQKEYQWYNFLFVCSSKKITIIIRDKIKRLS